MRRQFFLDARDYVKFGLLEDIMGIDRLTQLTIIWMLTPDQDSNHGQRTPVLETHRQELNQFFTRQPRPDLSDVPLYFNARGIPCNSYGDAPTSILARHCRMAYFESVPHSFLQRALVFVDPDNGLEPAGSATSAHLLYSELITLYSRLSDGSMLCIYQHRPRVPGTIFWPQVAGNLVNKVGGVTAWAALSDVAFFLLAHDYRQIAEVSDQLKKSNSRLSLVTLETPPEPRRS